MALSPLNPTLAYSTPQEFISTINNAIWERIAGLLGTLSAGSTTYRKVYDGYASATSGKIRASETIWFDGSGSVNSDDSYNGTSYARTKFVLNANGQSAEVTIPSVINSADEINIQQNASGATCGIKGNGDWYGMGGESGTSSSLSPGDKIRFDLVSDSGNKIKIYRNGSLVATTSHVNYGTFDSCVRLNNYSGIPSVWPRPQFSGSALANWVYEETNVTVAADSVVPVVTSFTATPNSTTQITIGYGASDNIAVTGWDLDWSPNGSSSWTSLLANVLTASPYVHSSLSISTAYYYRFRARDGAGNVSAYSYVNATTNSPESTPPTNVVILAGTVLGPTSGSWSFTPITDASGIAGIFWEFDTVNTFNSGNLIQTGLIASNTSPRNQTGLSANTLWYARARGKDNNNNLSASWSNIVSIVTWQVAPTITESSPLTTAELGVSYNNPISFSGGDGSVVISVESGYSLPSGFSISGNAVINANPSAIVVNHSTRLKAIDSKGQTHTKDFIFSVSDTAAPAAPTGLTATPININRIDTDSNVPSDIAGIKEYDTQIADDSGFTTNVFTYRHTNKAYSITSNLNPSSDKTYYIRRRAIDNNNNVGPYSTGISATVVVPLEANFSIPSSLIVGSTLAITDLSKGTSRAYKWYANGSATVLSTSAAPDLTQYLNNGLNSITQEVTNGQGTLSIIKYVTANPKTMTIAEVTSFAKSSLGLASPKNYKIRLSSKDDAGNIGIPSDWLNFTN